MARLAEIFQEIGLGAIDVPSSREDAQMIAEADGGGIEWRNQDVALEMCGGKACYRSRTLAEKVKLDRKRKGVTRLCSYHCPECGSWHLTSTKR